ncbi:calcineurin-binding protein cabin-1-like isoform X1 [Oculina patagonica]
MIRLCALNDDSSEESDHEPTQESVNQAKESEALELYNKGLALQQKGDYIASEEAYNQLLNSALVKEASPPEEDAGLVEPGHVLKYSAYKNLASLAEKREQWENLASLAEKKEQWEKSIDAYLQAVALDDSDVTVWYHLGVVALKTFDLCLARHSFEEGLKCNAKHWPCLDLLCTVLYAVGDYYTCLVMISKALERDEEYLKGIALRNQIFSEEPALRRDSQHLRNLFDMCYSLDDEERENEGKKFVKEALHLREERLKLVEADRAPPPPYKPVKALTSHTWASLGECFIALYDHLTSSENPQPLGRRVDLDGYYKAIVAPDISMSYRASVVKVPDYSSSSFSTEGFSVYKNVQTGDSDEKSKRGPKRKKPPPSTIDDFLPKRRSARVRTNKKKEEEINYKELVQSFIPSLFRPSVSVDDDSSQDSLGDGSQFSQRSSQSQTLEGKPGEGFFTGADRNTYDEITGEAETLDILTFVKEQMENGGIIDLMNQYGISLAAQTNKKWPPTLADVFLKVYQRMRKHVILPSEFCSDDEDALYRTRMAKLVLVASELTLDKLLTAKSKSSSSLSPASSPRGGGSVVSPLRGSGFSSQYLATDVEYLHRISCDQTIHGDYTLEMAIRVNWMRARYLMLQGQMDYAMMYLDRSSKLLTLKVNSIEGPTTVKLMNCKVDNLITLDQVQKKLESLQRCQSLEEVQRLYESGYYEDVVQRLMPTLHQPQPKTKVSELGMSIPERPAQLLLLQDSLIKLKDYEQCLTCSEVALNEAVSQMSPCEAWTTALSRLFGCIDRSILECKDVLEKIPQDKLSRLTQNVIKVLEASMYASESSSDPPLATAKPWVLLYRIIKHQEKYEETADKSSKTCVQTVPPPVDTPMPETASTDSNVSSVSVISDMPASNISPSLQFLRTAHEHLGRRGWCCNNEGVFLLLKVEVLTEELAKPVVPGREELVRDLEQCFLCLYGHPSISKKAKARNLVEHNSTQIALTWSNSVVVFDYFKPPEPPTFDSKSNTISAEVQNLLRRITAEIPKQELEAISFESVHSFIEGGDEPVPKLPDRLVGVKRPVINEIFYLLADFYFKNKEFSKALKFYMHDITVQPDRADTWAAMALARKSRLENKLNACETKSEGPIQKLAVSALRCFKRALEIDGSNSSLWEEYGTLCYVLYSHASRQLNQFDKDEMASDNRSSLLQRRDEMLLLSERCFTSALGIEDGEPWLHHYILGKITEKLKKPPSVYLEHYQKSAKYLDDDISSYPRKISYYSPPDHSLEALEIYFRIHVAVLKLLFDKFPDVDVSVLEEHLQRASQGPFYHPEFDTDTGQGTVYRSESTTSESLSNSVFEDPQQGEQKSSEAISVAESVSLPEPRQTEDLNLSQTEGNVPEEPKNTTMEVSSVGTAEDLTSKASYSQSDQSSAAVPMEVDLSAPSSGFTSAEQTPDSSQAPLTLGPSDSESLETSQSVKNLEEDKSENSAQGVKEKEEIAISEDNRPVLKSNAVDHRVTVDPCKKEEEVFMETSMEVDKLAAQETILYVEKPPSEETGKLQSPEVDKSSSEDKIQEGSKPSTDVEDTDMTTDEKKSSDEKTEMDAKPEKMETDEATADVTSNVEMVEAEKGVTTTHSSGPLTSTADSVTVSAQDGIAEQSKRAPLTAEQQAKKKELMDRCNHALEYCLRRFPQHHKSRYRLAYVYYYSPEHKETSACRDLLFGSNTRQHKTFPFPHQGVFNGKSKTNLFSAFWRIPEEDIDRPGCFCTHTYKSVALLLEVLKELNEWDTLLLIQTLLYRTPEQGKKYLRDNERHYLARKAFEYSLEIMKARVSNQDSKVEPSVLSQLVTDMYECWKTGQKYDPHVKVTESLLTQAFEMLVASKSAAGESLESMQENPESPSSLLDQALKYCQQHVKPQTSASNTSVSHQPKGSSGTDTGAELTSGSDTEPAPTTLEQTFSPPPKARKKESDSSAQEIERPAKTTAVIPRDLPTDSLSEEKSTVKIPTPNEDTPMVAEVPSSSEAQPMSKEVALDSSCLALERQSSKPVETKVNPAPTKGTAPQETNTAVPEPPITVTATAEVGNH